MKVRRADASGRLSLGRDFANKFYRVIRREDGSFELTPITIPEREQWLWKNKEALAAVRKGIEQSARGEGRYLGSFARYAHDELED